MTPGDATLLAVLTRNLVDNALRYSPARATVRITVQTGGAGVRLRVEDSGPGISDAAMQRLGERFFRILGNGEGSSGLGWLIVRRIATSHGARMQVSRSPALGGLCAEVVWPPPFQAG